MLIFAIFHERKEETEDDHSPSKDMTESSMELKNTLGNTHSWDEASFLWACTACSSFLQDGTYLVVWWLIPLTWLRVPRE